MMFPEIVFWAKSANEHASASPAQNKNRSIARKIFPFPALPGQVPDYLIKGFDLSRRIKRQHPFIGGKGNE
jgi:hypothetical protein